jgi:hypothetical protein
MAGFSAGFTALSGAMRFNQFGALHGAAMYIPAETL